FASSCDWLAGSLVQILLNPRQFQKRVRELFLVIFHGHRRLLIFESIDLSLQILSLFEERALGGIVRGLLRGAQPEQDEARREHSLSVVGRSGAHVFFLASILFHGVLGRQPFLRFIKRHRLAVGVLKSLQR